MRRKRKYDFKGAIVFIQRAREDKLENAKTIAFTWNSVLKHTKVHVRRGCIVQAAIHNYEDYNRMLDFAKKVNAQNRQKRVQEDVVMRAQFLNFERRAEFACHYIIDNPIVGDITKEAFEERQLKILKVRNEDGSTTWHLKQGEDKLIILNFKDETLEKFKCWLHETHHECITAIGIEKEPEQKEQVIMPLNAARNMESKKL